MEARHLSGLESSPGPNGRGIIATLLFGGSDHNNLIKDRTSTWLRDTNPRRGSLQPQLHLRRRQFLSETESISTTSFSPRFRLLTCLIITDNRHIAHVSVGRSIHMGFFMSVLSAVPCQFIVVSFYGAKLS